MNRDVRIFTVTFIIVVLFQVLICNHIALFNVAIPFLFIFFIIRLPISLNLNLLYTFAFLEGFIVDLFSDTPGINALSCVLLAAVKKPIFFAYVPRDDKTAYMTPSLYSMGWATYSKYLLSMTGLFCLLNFSIEYFSFASVKEIVIMTAASTILSFILILAADSLIVNNRERL
ncbi:MAG: hypothetical protein NC097_03160 [Clostridium sp.]|nr:rod shape-determining protein MreD [Prevotella sp.]MCM1428775.1 hypothetical protein [Clostridium sp.]MCM1475150.1 rod shape-determining protein MreD [Muribaculaceae bacterium]